MTTTEINHIFELDRLARDQVGSFTRQRAIVHRLAADTGKHQTGIVGPRGAGKTVALQQLSAKLKNSCYFSADTVAQGGLFDCVAVLKGKYGITTVCIDEIHFQKDFDQALKKVFDFLDVKVYFTSSVAIALHELSVDLSRRTMLLPLFPFSFREFVLFRTGADLPVVSFDDMLAKRWSPEHMRQEYLFDEYLRGGLMPFALDEPDPLPLLRNIAEKVIRRDIPSVRSIGVDELPLLEKCLAFTAMSGADGANYSSLARNVGITKYKAESYVDLLSKAYVFNPLFPAGANVLREPKILLSLPYRLLYGEFKQMAGGLREDFFAETMRMNGSECSYLKSVRGAKTPDFLVKTPQGELIIEIGGKGKGRSQFKGHQGEKNMILCYPSSTEGIRRPLFMAGFLS